MSRVLIGNIKGPQGDAATIQVGTVSTGAAGSAAAVTNSGTSSAATFNFTIPQGQKGEDGAPGVTDYASASAAGIVRAGNDVKVNSSNGTLSLNTDSITEPSTLTTLANGDSLATILGKVKSAISKVITIFSDYLTSSHIVNNFTTTAAGYALDARAGKTLNDALANKLKFAVTTASASISANAVAQVNITAPADTAYVWRPMTAYLNTGSCGIMEIQQTRIVCRNFGSSAYSGTLSVVWIGVQ